MFNLKGFVIVRTYSAGVFAGNLEKLNGKKCILRNAIRIHHWEGANSLSQLAMEGVKKPLECRFAIPVNEIYLSETIEIIPTTKIAEEIIKGVPTWRQ